MRVVRQRGREHNEAKQRETPAEHGQQGALGGMNSIESHLSSTLHQVRIRVSDLLLVTWKERVEGHDWLHSLYDEEVHGHRTAAAPTASPPMADEGEKKKKVKKTRKEKLAEKRAFDRVRAPRE